MKLKDSMYEVTNQAKLRSGLAQSLLHTGLPPLSSPDDHKSTVGGVPALTLSLCHRYRLAGLPGEYQQRNISSPEVNYCLVTDLIIWTQYEIQVAAYNGAGLGVFSRAVTEYTLQGGELRGGGEPLRETGGWGQPGLTGMYNSLEKCQQKHKACLNMGNSLLILEPNMSDKECKLKLPPKICSTVEMRSC